MALHEKYFSDRDDVLSNSDHQITVQLTFSFYAAQVLRRKITLSANILW